MIIHQPGIIRQNGYSILWTKIEIEKGTGFFPEYVWYRVPEPYGAYFTTQNDAFLVPGIVCGMVLGEELEVRGNVSPKLAYHLEEYQHILNFRFPDLLQRVNVDYERLAPLAVKPKAVGTTFSGGVDSLFTLWNHLPQNQPDPDYQVTHGLFIKGFDILHTAERNYRLLYDQYVLWADKIGLALIPIETNIVGITHKRLPLSYFHGPHILSCGISLGGLFQRFFMPSSWDYYCLRKKAYSSDPLVDPLLSTETLDIIHHGATHRRGEKIEMIADWELAQNILWVCQEHKFEIAGWNCSRCDKCFRTMIPIFVLGKLDKFKTFAKPIKSNYEGLRWARKFSLRHDFFTEMFPFIKKHKSDFLPWLRGAVFLGIIRNFLVTNMPGFARKWLRRFGYYVTRNEAPDAYEMAEITQIIRDWNDTPPTRNT
ncbi:hypothetical protein AMJ86_05920 [bacterium SM23_57]|nr:MAG: hypothetical protein AMJ86_05920 [bacterium SM23_57]